MKDYIICKNSEYFFLIFLKPSKEAENKNPNIKEKITNLNCNLKSII